MRSPGVHFVSDFSPKAGIQIRLCAGDRAVMRLPPTVRLLTILNYPTSGMRKVSCAEASAWSSVHTSTSSISCRLNSMGGSEAGLHDEIIKCTWFATLIRRPHSETLHLCPLRPAAS
jgi:hypothetical protein